MVLIGQMLMQSVILIYNYLGVVFGGVQGSNPGPIFGGVQDSNSGPCIYYALSLQTELSSRGRIYNKIYKGIEYLS